MNFEPSIARQTVEHRLARMMQLGCRQARYFGRAKTEFQWLIAATLANLTLAMGGPDAPTSSNRLTRVLLALLRGLPEASRGLWRRTVAPTRVARACTMALEV